MKSPQIHIYVTYDEEANKLMLSVERSLYSSSGRLVGIAAIHMTDLDCDSVPDTVTYTCYYFGPTGRLATSLNMPAGEPTEKDLDAWHSWLLVMVDQIDEYIQQSDNVDPDA